MVQIKKHPRNNRADYFAPIRYIDSSNVVSRTSMPALNTSEHISCRSISLTDMVAYWTGLRSICTGHEYKRHTCDGSLIFDKIPQLSECPGMVSASLSLSNRHSGSDAFEIFESDHSSSVFGFSNNILGNNMIGMSMKPSFPARYLFKMPLGTSCSGFLQVCLKLGIFLSGSISLLTTERNSIVIGNEIDNSHVNTESINRIELRRFRNLHNRSNIENIILQNEISLTSNPAVHPDFLIFSDPDRYFKSSSQRENRYCFKSLPGKDSLVINDRSIISKLRFDRLISLKSFRYFSDSTNNKLL